MEVTASRAEKSVYSKVTTWACPELVDTGVQYVSRGDVERLEQHGIQRSMSRLLLVSEDELTEATCETLHPREVRRALLDSIDRYDLKRRHSSMGSLSPVDCGGGGTDGPSGKLNSAGCHL